MTSPSELPPSLRDIAINEWRKLDEAGGRLWENALPEEQAAHVAGRIVFVTGLVDSLERAGYTGADGAVRWLRDTAVLDNVTSAGETNGTTDTTADLGERPQPGPRSEVDPSIALEDSWLIDGVLRPGRLVVIAGPEGLGKSHVRVEAGIRLSTCTGALFGHYGIPRRCRVLSFEVENGDEEEVRREEDVLAYLGLTRADLTDYWGVSLGGLDLTNPADQAYIRKALEIARPAVAFFDTGSSMVGEEWGTELKVAIRFLRSVAQQYGCAVVVFVHLVKPPRTGRKTRAKAEQQHGTELSDVMGQWTRQADTVAMMADAGAERVLWTVRKRAPHSQLVLRQAGGTFEAVQLVSGEDLGVGTMERVYQAISTGQADAAGIATYLDLTVRTVRRHIAKLREAGRVAPDATLRVSPDVSPDVSPHVTPDVTPVLSTNSEEVSPHVTRLPSRG